MNRELYLAGRYIFRGKAKHISFISVISCVGVAFGVWALIVVISVMNGFDRDLMERLLRFNYHIMVEGGSYDSLERIKKDIVRYDGVESASIFLQTQVLAKLGSYVQPLIVKGVDFSDAVEKKIFYKYLKEETRKDGFFVGEGLAKRYFIGESIDFYPLQQIMEEKSRPVRGTFKVGIYDIDNNYLVMDLKEARAIAPAYLTMVGVRIRDPFGASALKEKIKADFPKEVFVNTWMEQNKVLFSALKLEKIVMFIILSLIVLVASFNIFATLTVKVVEKTKDIGVLKALGFTSRKILYIFSLQGLLLGIIGVFAGTCFGVGTCIILKKYPFIKLPEEIYSIETLPVAINYRDILLIMVLGIILAFVSSLFPAVRASKLSPCEALRYE